MKQYNVHIDYNGEIKSDFVIKAPTKQQAKRLAVRHKRFLGVSGKTIVTLIK